VRFPDAIRAKLTQYRFEIRHILVLLIVLTLFQVILALFQKSLLDNFLTGTQSWFQKYHAERVAIVTSATLEILFQNQQRQQAAGDVQEHTTIYSFNIFVKQQVVQPGVEEISLFLLRDRRVYAVRNGQDLYDFFLQKLAPVATDSASVRSPGLRLFLASERELRDREKVLSTVINQKTFDVLVPFVPDGEYVGAMYMRVTPDFTFLTDEVRSNFDAVALTFSALILVGLIGIFLVSSRAVRDRDAAQRQLFAEHQEYLATQIRFEKESLFTKRIYHTHHKAEKIIGFIKEDVRRMSPDNLDLFKRRVITYSNFISRIIYDMKWYDQDINTIVNPIFHTDVNGVIRFIVDNVFLRISSKNEMFDFRLDLDPALPPVHVNEFIVWEILEPLIQNSIDHSGRSRVEIRLRTRYDSAAKMSYIVIEDNGVGIKPDLLEPDTRGTPRLFLAEETTRRSEGVHSGYGCYIAHQLAVQKCGWSLKAENLPEGGCRFTIGITMRGEG